MGKVKEYYFEQVEALSEMMGVLHVGNFEEYERLKQSLLSSPMTGMSIKENGLINTLPFASEELPRDFDLDFIDPIGDIDENDS